MYNYVYLLYELPAAEYAAHCDVVGLEVDTRPQGLDHNYKIGTKVSAL